MIRVPYEIFIVLDRDYGSRLRKLLESGPIWAVNSPANREVAQEIWKEFPSRDHLDGITIFTIGKGASPEKDSSLNSTRLICITAFIRLSPLTQSSALSGPFSMTNSKQCSPHTASTLSLLRKKDLERPGLCRQYRVGDARIRSRVRK
jgi:hypothetical protein